MKVYKKHYSDKENRERPFSYSFPLTMAFMYLSLTGMKIVKFGGENSRRTSLNGIEVGIAKSNNYEFFFLFDWCMSTKEGDKFMSDYEYQEFVTHPPTCT